MDKSLKTLSDEELQQRERELRGEQSRRIEERRKQALDKAIKANERVFQQVEALLAFTPEHDKKGCSDDNPRYYASDPRDSACVRCTLLHVKSSGYFDSDFELKLTLGTRSL